MPIGRYPTVRLAHRVKSTRYGLNMEYEYQTWPILIPRPETGSRSGQVECGTCRASFTYRVLSAPATVKRRRIWLWVLLATIAVVPTLSVYLWTNESASDRAINILAGLLFASMMLFWVSIVAWTTEDGVRGRHRFNRRPVHAIRGKAAAARTPPPVPPPG